LRAKLTERQSLSAQRRAIKQALAAGLRWHSPMAFLPAARLAATPPIILPAAATGFVIQAMADARCAC